MRIKELFQSEVTRDIPPVVYFHEQDPQKLREEVSEYIITGGYPKGDPRAKRVDQGIHEGFTSLLKGISSELDKRGGPELPASWISGFYGSGKSSFAKLLGLGLDGAQLDDGRSLADALLARDTSPNRKVFVDLWNKLLDKIDPISVVFDIGAVARDNEHIHAAALRQIQNRLGYCSKSNLVAKWELTLEGDGEWEVFLQTAEKTLGKPWAEGKEDQQAEDHFSHILHVMHPDRYQSPLEWLDARDGIVDSSGSAVKETIDSISAMLSIRAPGRVMFLVIDEVSQYVHQDDDRMLKLQSFVSELGHRLKGKVWILATGQQKLEDNADTTSLSKLKDRFPPKLRVHLGANNIRDVVHKRLLQKAEDKETILRELFSKHRSDLKLYGYSCEEITEEDFVEVYPMLPGHVDLLLQITSNLRTRSSRIQGDDHAIRGLLQLLGELFREQKLAEGPVGELVTLDKIYEIQQTALDPDVQTAMNRILAHSEFRDDPLAIRAAKVVSLLEMIQEQIPTTAEMVAKCLYETLGQGNNTQAVSEALERLRSANLLGYSEKQGYKIQSSAGQEWERERREISAIAEKKSQLVIEKLAQLLSLADAPRWKGNRFLWTAWYSDGRSESDVKIKDVRGTVSVMVDFRYLTKKDDRMPASWVQRSDSEPLRNRIVWVVGDSGRLGEIARDLLQSRGMLKKYEARYNSLPSEKKRMYAEEQTRQEELENRMQNGVAEAFFNGTVYFRGRSMEPRDRGSAFASALTHIGEQLLPEIYTYFTEIAITDTELAQLLEKELSGPSTKFMDAALGILTSDAGKYMPSCSGEVPTKILKYLGETGVSGSHLIAHFQDPPYGYPADVTKACIAGLLRAGKIRIRPDEGPEITSVRDPGTKDLFRLDTKMRRAEILPAGDTGIGGRDRIAICKFFHDFMGLDLDRENDAIADAVFQQFPLRREQLREIETKLEMLPLRPELPAALQKLGKAMEACRRVRHVEPIVLSVKQYLDVLRDGFQQLGIYKSDLTDEVVDEVRRASDVKEFEISQLKDIDKIGEVAEEASRIENQLKSDRPWRGIQEIQSAVQAIQAHYKATRRALLSEQTVEQEKAANRVKSRDGFERLDADQAHRVLRPIQSAVFDTTDEAVAPTLAEMKNSFPYRLGQAEERANELFDVELAKETDQQVEKVPARIRGREIANREQLDALLQELDERIDPLLKKGARVRLV